MNIKSELEAMSKRMFADELMNKILAAHKKELADTGFEAGEQSCAEAGQALAAMLNEGQRKSLAEVEAAHWDSLKYALKFSFTRGVYVGFHQTIFYKGIMPSEKVLDFPVDRNTLTGSVNL